MTRTKAEVRVMIEKTRNNTVAGGALVFPTKSKRDKVKDKMYIRGFYTVATDPDIKLPHIDRVKFVYTCVVNGKEDGDFTWITLKEIYEDKNEE